MIRVLEIKLLSCFVGLAIVAGTIGAANAETVSSITRGGQLYDKWFKVIKAEKPTQNHTAWPASNTKKKGDVTWRCKSCHGWDLMGRDGAYSKGSYKTGIVGLRAFSGKKPDAVIAVMKDATHGLGGMMDDRDFNDLANFVVSGQVDMDMYIDRGTKKMKGAGPKGAAYFNTICANCHGMDGKKVKDAPPLGKVAAKNPWEAMHKILNGQPAEAMPALRAFDIQVTVDIINYMQTLPKE